MRYAQLDPADTNFHRLPEPLKARPISWTALGIGFGIGVLCGTLATLLALKTSSAAGS